jgi:hypothetical protein
MPELGIPDRVLLWRRRLVRTIRYIRSGQVRDGERTLRIGDLTGRDAVHEGLERPSLVPITRQCPEDRDADLLRHVIHHVGAAGVGPEPRPHVAVGHRAHAGQKIVQCRPVACACQRGEITEFYPILGVRRHMDLGHLAPSYRTVQPHRCYGGRTPIDQWQSVIGRQ